MNDTERHSLKDAFASLLGPAGWLTGPDAAPYCHDWLDRFSATPLGVARPADTAAVAATLALCHRHGITVTPQGGNTGLNGGSIPGSQTIPAPASPTIGGQESGPDGAGRPAIILQTGRLRAIESIDRAGRTVRVQAGVALQQLHDALETEGLQFPMHLGSQGSAQIGGLLATNAGGSHVLRYGMMSDLCLGLEVVLADGRIWHGDRALLKDNTGYPLRRLFCGAEGTLGVITTAVLRVFPAPVQRSTALLASASLPQAVALCERLRAEAGDLVSALEFLTASGLDMLASELPEIAQPLEGRPAVVVLAELDTSSTHIPLDDILAHLLESVMTDGLVDDGVLAESEAQRAAFWRIREELPEAQRRLGAQLKHDVSVPVAALAGFIAEADAAVTAVMPGVRINPFGHLADGNVHYNLSPPSPAAEADFQARSPALRQAVYDVVARLGGSFSAEHGLGQDKVALADRYREPVERELMQRLKRALDPDGLLNPGKVVRCQPDSANAVY